LEHGFRWGAKSRCRGQFQHMAPEIQLQQPESININFNYNRDQGRISGSSAAHYGLCQQRTCHICCKIFFYKIRHIRIDRFSRLGRNVTNTPDPVEKNVTFCSKTITPDGFNASIHPESPRLCGVFEHPHSLRASPSGETSAPPLFRRG
jgi:hypothetical protein